MINLDKLNNIATPDPSWMQDAGDRIQNKEWLEKSAKIALKILRALKNSSMTQKELADKLSVTPQQINKIVKGRENLTLETICKIEKELDIELICVELSKTVEYSTTEFMKINKRGYSTNALVIKLPTVKLDLNDKVSCISPDSSSNGSLAA